MLRNTKHFILLLFVLCSCQEAKKSDSNAFTKRENPNIDLVQKFQETVVQLGKVYEETANTQKKVDTLTLALSASGIKGCKASEPITRIEVTLDGEHEEDNNISGQVSPEEGKKLAAAFKEPAKTMIFKFSLGIARGGKAINFENDEAAHVLFVAGGTKAVNVPEGFVIGDIDYIKIEKVSPNYQVMDVCATMAPGTCKDKYIISEKDRYRLSGLTIKVNSQKIYLNEKLNFVFSKYNSAAGEVFGMSWIEEGIKLNPQFLELMGEPCSQ